MEIYQVRWTIEVFFKESKQHLGLGKCQSNDLDAHFTDVNVTMVQYVLLTLKKRFENYETKGALFRDSQEQMLELTLMHRLWGLFIEIATQFAGIFGIDTEELMEQLFQNEKVNKMLQKLFIPEKESGAAAKNDNENGIIRQGHSQNRNTSCPLLTLSILKISMCET